MKLMLFGVTGGTGAQLLAQALGAGHQVTAVARDPARVPVTDPDAPLTVLPGDALAPETWRQAVAGHDAVLSCLGSTDRKHPTTVYSQGTRNLVEAMRASGVGRLLCLSSAGLEITPEVPLPQRLVTRYVIQRLYRHGYADMARMESLVRSPAADGTAWTVVRPPMLTDGPLTGTYRTAENARLERPKSLSRADLAHYLLTHVDDRRAHRAVVEVAY
ncbi:MULTISPECIES: NAD(P)-dependent oxidoreductase [Streptomyces]|jgi:putative NADH-flavin reductase|uniref:Putative NADH-flavin reductase n=1 Tax=Streptomyces nymphaeiformis TaxID=2663842 RepID=A0A7W7XCQ0_9ACTN|nr:NAD(P)H-binding protein [Streptomyces nymphaeiformis]MBB4982443.1 putative NADH-flavin reductase [Streptomyces nymphaeiformis]